MANVQHSSLAGNDLHPQIKYYQGSEPSSAGEAEGDLWWDSDDDTLHYYDGADWVALAVGSATAVVSLPHWKTGRYYDANYAQQASSTTAALSANTLYAAPLFVQATSAGGNPSIDRIGINVTAGGGSGFNARLGIYAMGTDGLPGTLTLDAGTVALTSNTSFEITGLSQALTGNTWYFTAIVSDGTPTLTSYSSMQQSIFGVPAINTGNTFDSRPQRAFAYAALPNPFGTPATTANGVAFAVRVRAA